MYVAFNSTNNSFFKYVREVVCFIHPVTFAGTTGVFGVVMWKRNSFIKNNMTKVMNQNSFIHYSYLFSRMAYSNCRARVRATRNTLCDIFMSISISTNLAVAIITSTSTGLVLKYKLKYILRYEIKMILHILSALCTTTYVCSIASTAMNIILENTSICQLALLGAEDFNLQH